MKAQKSVSRTLAALALSLCGFAGSASATSISIANGSFESGTLVQPFTTVGTGGTNIDDWAVSGSVDYIGNYWQAADGVRSLDMNGFNSAGKITQQIVVPEDGNVTIRFAMAGNVDNGPALKILAVSLVSLDQTFSFLVTNQTKSNMGWLYYSAVFTGVSAGSYTLGFESQIAGSFGPALDDISASVPDGGTTLSLLGIALAGFGFLRRKQA